MPRDTSPPQASTTTANPAASTMAAKMMAPKVPDGFAKVTIPARYGAVYVKGPDGKEREFKGGDVAVVPERQAKGWGALPTTAPLKGEGSEANVEEVGIDKQPTA